MAGVKIQTTIKFRNQPSNIFMYMSGQKRKLVENENDLNAQKENNIGKGDEKSKKQKHKENKKCNKCAKILSAKYVIIEHLCFHLNCASLLIKCTDCNQETYLKDEKCFFCGFIPFTKLCEFCECKTGNGIQLESHLKNGIWEKSKFICHRCYQKQCNVCKTKVINTKLIVLNSNKEEEFICSPCQNFRKYLHGESIEVAGPGGLGKSGKESWGIK